MIIVPERLQGPTNSGQGGWTAHEFAQVIAEPVTIAIKAPIPLETELQVQTGDDGWRLTPADQADNTILHATRWDRACASTSPVSIETARAAKAHFPYKPADHPLPYCFSCGLEPDSMQAHPGPIGDGRWATDWTVPDWAVRPDGSVNEGTIWAAIDCTQGFYAGGDGDVRHSLTVQLAVDVLMPLSPGATYSLVAWNGTFERGWDGRKRGAGGAVFDADGNLVAQSSSFWISI